MRSDIECPGDTIPYNCSIQSNTESPELIWTVTIPGRMPISIRYDNTSNLNIMDDLGLNITSTLTVYSSENELNHKNEYLESVIVLTVLKNVSMSETLVNCAIADLKNNTASILVNTSGL